MAVLTATELQRIRQTSAQVFGVVAYTKTHINAALQAIEDAMLTRVVSAGDVTKTWPTVMSGIIDAASTPFVFTAPQKKLLFALWAELKFQRDK